MSLLAQVLSGSNVKRPYIRYLLFPTIFGLPMPSYILTPVSVVTGPCPLEIRTISECGAHWSLCNGCQNSIIVSWLPVFQLYRCFHDLTLHPWICMWLNLCCFFYLFYFICDCHYVSHYLPFFIFKAKKISLLVLLQKYGSWKKHGQSSEWRESGTGANAPLRWCSMSCDNLTSNQIKSSNSIFFLFSSSAAIQTVQIQENFKIMQDHEKIFINQAKQKFKKKNSWLCRIMRKYLSINQSKVEVQEKIHTWFCRVMRKYLPII